MLHHPQQYFKKNKDTILLISLILIGIVVHIEWFKPLSIITHEDFTFWFDEYQKKLAHSFIGSWLGELNLGQPNIQIYFSLSRIIWWLLANVGMASVLAIKITHLWPIAILGFVSPYFFSRELVKNQLIAFVCALFYGSTTYFLMRQTSHLPIAFVYALSPLLFYFFIRALKQNTLPSWLVFCLGYWVGVCYEARIMYILTLILFFYFVIFYIISIKKYWKNLLISILCLLGLNLFWILPSVQTGVVKEIVNVASRPLSANQLFDLLKAFTVFDHSWTGMIPKPFVSNRVFWYFWSIPIIVFSGLLFSRDQFKKARLFFAVTSLVGIFLAKQTAEPFLEAYPWLREHIPGFVLFRTVSKFYLIICLGYLGLLSYGLLCLKQKINFGRYRFLYYLAIIAVIFVALWNLKPLFTKKIRTTFISREIPADYLVFKNHLVDQSDYYRVFWFPVSSRWSFYSIQHPKLFNIEGVNAIKNWQEFLDLNKLLKNAERQPIQEELTEIFYQPFTDQWLDNMAVQYVAVPIRDKQNDDDFYIWYGNDRQYFIDELDKIDWLEKIDIGTQELAVYENKNYKPHIYSSSQMNFIAGRFGSFAGILPSENVYRDKELADPEFLLPDFSNIIVPLEPNWQKIEELEQKLAETDNFAEIKNIKEELSLASKVLLDNYKIDIPQSGEYQIWLKDDSLLANNQNLKIKIGSEILNFQKDKKALAGWQYFHELYLPQDTYDFAVYTGSEKIASVNWGEIALVAKDLRMPVDTPKIEYRQINSTKYVINVYGAEESFPLIFSESFNNGWRLYLNNDLADKRGDKFVSAENQGTVQNENLIGGRYYNIFFKKPILEDRHFQVNGFANGWWIDPRLAGEIQNPKHKIQKNSDGSYDFSLTVEFEPQKYFYLGLLISGLTLMGCLGYLIYHWKKPKPRF